jgi:2-methylcitrate dehydratase
MSAHDIRSAKRPDPDQPLVDIANYVADYRIDSKEAYDTARYMLLDSLATAMMAMKFPECVKHLGPVVPGATLPGGARVPGTSHELDPVQAAFAIGTQRRSGAIHRTTSVRFSPWPITSAVRPSAKVASR